MNTNTFLRGLILILILGSFTMTEAGPVAYAACIAACCGPLAILTLGIGTAGCGYCLAGCAPALTAPTP